ncbi:hypothetical protein K440DRAFT_641244 [Wilcoxina mikolae CBS 423.85]|nr:hypothetical protein K440DRAFT_641244 [Wilcoxina mikolae CBS 423.85]
MATNLHATASADPGIIFVSKNVACRPADWMDVGKFLLLNYGLHAVTTASYPGQALRASIIIGMSLAALKNDEGGKMKTAHRARALCMGLKYDGDTPLISQRPCESQSLNKFYFALVNPSVWKIHGKHPVPTQSHCSSPSGPRKIIIAAKGLYDAQGHQVEKFGYAAYSFTVLPYLFMSLINLVAVFCEPQYPALYLVEFIDDCPDPITVHVPMGESPPFLRGIWQQMFPPVPIFKPVNPDNHPEGPANTAMVTSTARNERLEDVQKEEGITSASTEFEKDQGITSASTEFEKDQDITVADNERDHDENHKTDSNNDKDESKAAGFSCFVGKVRLPCNGDDQETVREKKGVRDITITSLTLKRARAP